MPVQFNSVAPVFVVSDVGATVRWYEEHLGFTYRHFPEIEPWVWANIQRDGVEIMFMRIEGYKKPDLSHLRSDGVWDAYIRISGINEFYEAVKAKWPIKMKLRKMPYGDSEFEICDPNGYILTFSDYIE
jgi:uncharacterized glyoxalase superfamily protein PhnB